jgi:4-amino-4-deoxy-L-arabinose transferase-like glycosyltransferase
MEAENACFRAVSAWSAAILSSSTTGRAPSVVGEIAAIALLWAVATAFNVTKAVHIDDTAYLEIARAIRADPLHAMRGELDWTQKLEPIYTVNQPHLFFYPLALSMALFGENEVAFHLVESVFTLAALVFFYLLARQFCNGSSRCALYLSALFVLGPAVLPGQNVMCDMPMLACWLGFLWALLTPRRGDRLACPLLAAALAAAACLIKYTSLVLLPLLLTDLLWRGERRRLWLLTLPIAVLGAWSLFNYFDYGGMHILGREKVPKDAAALFGRAIGYLLCLGAVTPFSPLLLSRLPIRSRGLLLAALTVGVALLIQDRSTWRGEPVWSTCLRAGFLINGLVVVGSCLAILIGQLARHGFRPEDRETHAPALLMAWLLGSAAFVVIFAPFLAVRHVLPAIPVALLLIGTPSAAIGWKSTTGHVLAMVATVGLGIALALSDWLLADVYRQEAPRLAERLRETPQTTIWYVGHWGWQWYAERAGFRRYDPGRSEVRAGDYLVIPEMVPRQDIDPGVMARLHRIDSVVIPSGRGTILRTARKTPQFGYYALLSQALPWTPTTEPLEEFTILRADP